MRRKIMPRELHAKPSLLGTHRSKRVFAILHYGTSLPALLLLLWAVPPARANVINACSPIATAGETMTCSFANSTTNPTGILTVDKIFTQTPGTINVSLGLTNTIAGNNVLPGIYTYAVTETIHNRSGIAWWDFHIVAPDASLVSGPTASGFTSCTSSSIKAFDCSGGTVSGTLTLTFNLGTPSDQSAGAFFIGNTPSVPEPGAGTMAGLGLVALGWWGRRRASAFLALLRFRRYERRADLEGQS